MFETIKKMFNCYKYRDDNVIVRNASFERSGFIDCFKYEFTDLAKDKLTEIEKLIKKTGYCEDVFKSCEGRYLDSCGLAYIYLLDNYRRRLRFFKQDETLEKIDAILADINASLRKALKDAKERAGL